MTVPTTLAAGDIAIIGYNTEDTGNPQLDSISFVLLQAIIAGTVVYFSDRTWNGVSFTAPSGDGTYTYTAGANLPAGTVVTITQAQLNGVGIDLSDSGETIYVYQGTTANTPTNFIYALDVADGNTNFDGSLLNTGLSVASGTAAAIGVDNASFGTRGYDIQLADLRAQISNPTDWVQNDNSPQAPQLQGGGNFFTAPDKVIWVAGAGGGDGIAMVSLDSTVGSGDVGYQLMQAFQNDTNLYHPSDLTLDTVHDRFFMIDADLSGNNRVVQGSISQVLANPGAPIALTVLYSNAGSGAAGSIRTLSVDTANKIIYFDVATTFNKIGYDTAAQTPVQLANLGANNYITQATIDYTHGEVYLGSSRVSTVFGQDVVSKNYVYQATGLIPASTTLTFGQLAFNPDDNDATPPNNANIIGLTGEAWPVELGTIRGVDVDPVNHDLYIVTGTVILDTSAAQDGSQLTTFYGGVYRYDLDSNPSGNVTQLYKQNGSTGPVGLLYYIEVDPSSGKYYVVDTTGTNALPGDGSVWVGSLATPGTPSLVSIVGNINGLGPQGLEIQSAPVLGGAALSPTITETAGDPSPAPTAVQPANGFTGSDVDSGAAPSDQLAGAQVRVSANFQSGATHQDLLTINGTTSGTTGASNQISYSYSSSTGVMTLTGITTIAAYNAALALVRYDVTGDDPTAYGTAGSRTISYSTFDGLLYSDEVNSTVTVIGVNDAPVNTVGSAASATEDGTAFTLAGLSIFDVDANPAAHNMLVTLSVAHGTISIRTDVVGGIVAGDITAGANGSATFTITATQAKVNATLAASGPSGLTYTPTGNFNGADTLTIVTNDQGASGTDAGLSGTATSEQDSDPKTINVSAVNDAPVVVGGTTQAATAIFEDQPSAAGQTVTSLFGTHFDDSIDNQTAFSGSSANTLAGIAITANGSNANGNWQYYNGAAWTNIGAASVSAAVLVTAGTAIRFNPAADFNGSAPTLDAHLVDSSGAAITNGTTANLTVTGGTTPYSSGAVTLSETVNPVNDAPISSNLSGNTATYIEGGAAVKLDVGGDATLADIDSADFSGGTLTVSVTGNAAASEDLISIGTTGAVSLSGANVVVSGNTVGTFTGGTVGANLVITMNTFATPAAMQEVLRALQYTNTNNGNPSTAARTVTVTLTDGDGTANGGTDTMTTTTTVNVTAVNDAPAGADNAKTILEDGAYTFANADFGFTDPVDAGANTLQSVVFTTVPANGSLMYDADGPGGAAAVALTNGSEVPASNIALGRLTFVPVADANGTPYTTFTFQVRDNGGTANGGVDLDQSANTFTMNVTAVNDAPVLDLDTGAAGTGFTTTFTEGPGLATGTAVSITAAPGSVLVTDVDSANLAGATITLTNVQPGDLLSVNGALPGGIVASSYNSGTGVLTLSGTATKAAYQTALTQVQFSNSSQNPVTTDRAITVTLTDDAAATSIAATTTVHVAATNDAPVLDLDANNSTVAGTGYQGAYIPAGPAVPIVDIDTSITDPDDTNIESATVTLTNVVKTNDVIGVSAPLPGGITASSYDSVTGVITLTGSATLAQYASALQLLRFSSTSADTTTTRTITITVNDGDINSNTATSSITLNQPPTVPVDSNLAGNAVTEGAALGTAVGVTAFSTDPEAGAITYSLSNDAGGRFQINSSTGVVTVSAAGATTIDYESAAGHAYSITAVATDPQNGTSSQTFVINVGNAAPASPTDGNAAANTVSEGASTNATVGVTATASDVNGGAITYSLTNNAGGRFAIDSATGVVTVANASLLNYESATSHNITIHAQDPSGLSSADTVVAIAVTNVPATSAVDTDGVSGGSVAEGAAVGTAVGITASSSDVNGGTITYSLVNNAGGRFAINSSTGVVTVANGGLLDYETATSHNITVHAADPSGAASADTTFAIAVTNVAPSSAADSNGAANSVSEAAATGATVGVTALATDVNGGTITYSLADNAGGRFAIDSLTGIVTVANASLLDFETATSHNITVHAADPANASSVDTVISIAVTNAAPSSAVDSDAAVNTVSEGASNGATVGVTASSIDVHGGTITYSLANNAGGRFAIDSGTGVVTVANASLLNYESATSHDIVVHAQDPSGASSSNTTFTIQVSNVAPTSAVDSDGATGGSVSEGAVNAATVGVTASASDVNGGAITYSLANNAGGRFAIDAATGVVTVANASLLDFESATSHSITVHAADASGAASADTTFTIQVTNVAPATPVDGDAGANSVSEGAANGATVGVTASSSDIHGGSVTFSLADSAGGRFAINSATGVVTVANASLLDFETATSHSITVQASDGTASATQTFVIAVTDAPPVTPVDSDAGANTVSEGAVNGATVGVTGASSDVHGGVVTYSLSDSAGGRFAVNAATGVVTVANASLLDFETSVTHNITLRASDPSGAFTESTFAIAVTNVAPSVATDSNAAANAVSEAAANGATVGLTALSTDVHGGTVTYSLFDSAGGRFAIDASTGVVTVANATLLDYETATSHNITVRASDPSGAFNDQVFAIAVLDAPPTPAADVNAATNLVAENAANGTLVGITAASTDPHGGTVTYALQDSAGGRFAINASTGVVTVANGSLLDYEAAHSYNITVRASDASGAFADQAFSIALGDVNDVAPTITNALVHHVFENSTLVTTLASTDPDTVGTNPATFSIVGGADQAVFSIVGGNLVFTSAPDFESPVDQGFDNTYVVQVQAFDGVNTTVKTLTVIVKDVNDKPAGISTPSNLSVNEGQTVVTHLQAIDPDTVGFIPAVFSINGGPDGANFSVVDGNLVFNAPPDHENATDSDHNNVYLVEVKAFDGVHNTLKLLSVTVNDLNDTAPVLTVASPIGVNENTTLVATLTSTDADTVSSGPATYSITGGADAAMFEIVGGQLKFKVAPDFNTPHDVGADNGYLVQVTASDGIQGSNKMLTVNVLDLGLHLVGDANANNLVGGAYDDTFVGNGGNDTMNGHAGNDTIDGSAGIDTAVFAGNKAAYSVVVTSPGHMTVTGPDGNDGLTSVERLAFDNAHVAFDLDGNAGVVVKLLGALFGVTASHNATFVGVGIGYADEGATELQLATLVVNSDVFALQAGSHSNTDFVNYVYQNLFGASPAASLRAELVGLLDSHALTQGQMAVIAAELDVNAVNVGLAGLAAHGIDYIPY